MATTDRVADRVSDTAGDARDQIRQLRDQVDNLMRERVTPIISDAAGRAQDAMHRARDAASHAKDVADDQAEALSGHVRDMPLTSILIAAAAGYLLGRFTR